MEPEKNTIDFTNYCISYIKNNHILSNSLNNNRSFLDFGNFYDDITDNFKFDGYDEIVIRDFFNLWFKLVSRFSGFVYQIPKINLMEWVEFQFLEYPKDSLVKLYKDGIDDFLPTKIDYENNSLFLSMNSQQIVASLMIKLSETYTFKIPFEESVKLDYSNRLGMIIDYYNKNGLIFHNNQDKIINLSFYENHDVRDDFELYGGSFNLVTNSILYRNKMYETNEIDYDRILEIFIATFSIDIIIHQHLILSHIVVAQKLYKIATTNEIKNSGLVNLLKILLVNTSTINERIPFLAIYSKNSIFNSLFAFKDLNKLLFQLYDNYKEKPINNIVKNILDLNENSTYKNSYHQLLKETKNLIHSLINEDLPFVTKEELTSYFFMIIIYHKITSDFSINLFINSKPKIYKKNYKGIKLEDYCYLLLTLIGTSTRVPKLYEIISDNRFDFLSSRERKLWTYYISKIGDIKFPFDFKLLDISVGS